MALFGWIAEAEEPPACWDLRQHGWTLCHGTAGCRAECCHVLVCDTRRLSAQQRFAMAEADRPAWRLIMLGIEEPDQRARLLNMGCADVLPMDTDLHELQARVLRVNEMIGMLPRWRNLGALTLDLFHRDARRGARWLNLHPREFGVLWRLSDKPGERVTRKQLLKDVWRLHHDPETNSVEVHVSRLRTKLAGADCAQLVETALEGGYRLADVAERVPVTGQPDGQPEVDALDDYLSELGWARVPAE